MYEIKIRQQLIRAQLYLLSRISNYKYVQFHILGHTFLMGGRSKRSRKGLQNSLDNAFPSHIINMGKGGMIIKQGII